jgi:hypothetical protein
MVCNFKPKVMILKALNATAILILTANGVIKNRVENSKIFGRFFMIQRSPAMRLFDEIAANID